ncbi:hypothetical protein P171DRAFT_485350 [Karstenula rhodostoma CBS 690.94]|uniref:C2H2-type domain-containing protein n=1 Tax=Karstenula rhodostoma CBS 690.94 TaxID=1392251 RepID=A0A9P4PJQ5_9PLEO|nr:hypothetical protein P171DRAFT_485350 [Karstenula rhodostoma CBS 690.94]
MSHLHHKCTQCDRTFAKLDSLWAHFHLEHPTSSRYSCPVCNRLFLTATHLDEHAGYSAAAPSDKVIHAHYCSGHGCGKRFCSFQARDMHESACKFLPKESKIEDNEDKYAAEGDKTVAKTMKKTEHRELFRAVLEADKVIEFVPVAGRSSNTVFPGEQPATGTMHKKETGYTRSTKKRKGKATAHPAQANNLAHKSRSEANTSNYLDAGAPSFTGGVVDLDNWFADIANDPRYALCSWTNCGNCGRCMEGLYPDSHQETYYAGW